MSHSQSSSSCVHSEFYTPLIKQARLLDITQTSWASMASRTRQESRSSRSPRRSTTTSRGDCQTQGQRQTARYVIVYTLVRFYLWTSHSCVFLRYLITACNIVFLYPDRPKITSSVSLYNLIAIEYLERSFLGIVMMQQSQSQFLGRW